MQDKLKECCSWEKWSEVEWGVEYREMIDYAEYIFDEVRCWEDNDVIEFEWEEWYWGGREYKSESFDKFEDFAEFYENLKNS
jgi:hypothetical protein